MDSLTKRNAITCALYVLGHDENELARVLGIPVEELVSYLQGTHAVSTPVLLKAIELVLDKTRADNATQREMLRKIKDPKNC